MDTPGGLDALQARKRDLLLESDANRQVLRLETEQIRLRAVRWQQGYQRLHVGWKLAAPLAGFLLARKFKKVGGLFTRGSIGLVVLRKLWETFNKPSR